MRSLLTRYEMRRATNLESALATLAEGDWRAFAGGTDLMVLLDAGKLPHRRFVDIWSVSELRGIKASADEVTIGGLTTYTDLLESPLMQSEYPLICTAARETGAVAIQNRGTVGGNIANGSPAADLPPALLVYDARLELASARGRRIVDYDRFHTGYKEMDLAGDELIVSVRLPRTRERVRVSYRKVGTRRAQAISKICFAALAQVDASAGETPVVRDVRLAFGSVAPTVVRARTTEGVLRGRSLTPLTVAEAREALRVDITPIDDIRSTADYRLKVAGNLLEEFLS
jgi:CO/xanthine dehydrogenase FAD-binding subunit